jgi:hypothetical protein
VRDVVGLVRLVQAAVGVGRYLKRPAVHTVALMARWSWPASPSSPPISLPHAGSDRRSGFGPPGTLPAPAGRAAAGLAAGRQSEREQPRQSPVRHVLPALPLIRAFAKRGWIRQMRQVPDPDDHSRTPARWLSLRCALSPSAAISVRIWHDSARCRFV